MQGSGLRVEALGVAGAPAPDRLTTTFRLEGGVIVDTGAIVHGAPPADAADITAVLLSHSHLDHTLGLPFLLAARDVRVLGHQETLDAVRESLLDGRIWPDLCARGSWDEVAEGDTFQVGPWTVEAGGASHTVPCLSYLFRAGGGALAIVGDTRRDDAVMDWIADRSPTDCVVEVSYPADGADRAERFGHQSTLDLPGWRAALGPACRIHVTHIKPRHETAVRAECEALNDPALHILTDGDVFEV